MNIEAGNKANMTKKLDCGNRVVAQPNDEAHFLKRPVSLDAVVRALY